MRLLDFVRNPRGILSLLVDIFRDHMRLRHWNAPLSFNDSLLWGACQASLGAKQAARRRLDVFSRLKFHPPPGGEPRCLEVIPIPPGNTPMYSPHIYHSYIRGRSNFRKNLCEESPP